ncbi:MAG: DUF971 domain-containing protein [Acidobacteriia bacterium]|nr:DUF971 domain-containing protein [Terriglobia bacterium]
MAPATAASPRPEEVHPRFIGGPDGPPASVSVVSMAKTSGVPMDPISTNPKEINVSREKRQVHIRWQDGHESVYGFDLLRKECPCALCNDHRSKQSMSRGLSLTVLSGPVIQAGQIQVTEVKPAKLFYRAQGQPDAVEARRTVLGLGVGRHIQVKTTTGKEYHGNIQTIDTDTFTMLPDRQTSSVEIPFLQVQYVEQNLSKFAKIAIAVFVAGTIAIVVLVVVYVHAVDKSF